MIDSWIKRKIGLSEADDLIRKRLEDYQLFRLRKTLAHAKKNSIFYRELYEKIDIEKDIKNLNDIKEIPFLTPDDLKENGNKMICVPQSNISRIVTLDTSGSTGKPKRVYFTENDQELTKDYFNYGLRVMTNTDDVFMILLPCTAPGSVGDLVRIGLERNGVKVISYGFPSSDQSQDREIINIMKQQGVTSLVGTASSVTRLSEKSKINQGNRDIVIRTVLLSAEYVSTENVADISENWNCEVFEHYGMTETGLGGAMACESHEGYHPREADLLFEIIDPKSGEVLPEGEYGEIVFTTLTREGMPLIRYRTGDVSRWIFESCPCGSILNRLDRVGDRKVRKNL